MPSYTIKRTFDAPYETVEKAVRAALPGEGFGVMSEIDVQARMREKLGKEMARYMILGACAPPLAWEGLQAAPDLGVLLPCNVVVYEEGDGRTTVSAMEPKAVLPVVDEPTITQIAEEVSARLHRVVDGLQVTA